MPWRKKELPGAKNMKVWTLVFGEMLYSQMRVILRLTWKGQWIECTDTVKHPVKVMVWSCFSSKKVGRIALIAGNMNGTKYIETLESKLLPSIQDMGLTNPYFIDDSAPCHRSKLVTDWKEKNNIRQIFWPGNSPDLNPIENLWPILKYKLRKKANPNTRILCENIIQIWYNEINRNTLENLADSIP